MVGDTLAGEGEQKENCGGFIRQAARCGVEVSSLRWGEANTYGATGCSWRLLRMGSDMVADDYGRQKNCCVLCCKWMGRSASLRSTRTGARSAFSPGHPAKARYSLQEVPLGVRVPLYTLHYSCTSPQVSQCALPGRFSYNSFSRFDSVGSLLFIDAGIQDHDAPVDQVMSRPHSEHEYLLPQRHIISPQTSHTSDHHWRIAISLKPLGRALRPTTTLSDSVLISPLTLYITR